MEYNSSQFDHEREYDERYYLFKNHIQELISANLIYINKNNDGEYFVDKNFNTISKVLLEDLYSIGEGMNSDSIERHDGEGIVDKYKIWTWFKCNKGMLFNMDLIINENTIL
jgi:hypothetical protein